MEPPALETQKEISFFAVPKFYLFLQVYCYTRQATKLYAELQHISIEHPESQTYPAGVDTNAMFTYYNILLYTLAHIYRDRIMEVINDTSKLYTTRLFSNLNEVFG